MDDGAGALEHIALERTLLSQISQFTILYKLRLAVRSRRPTRFKGDVAVVVCRLRMLVCDVLIRNIQRLDPVSIIDRHRETNTMIGLVRRVCADPTVLSHWGYSAEQQAWLVERLGPAVGHGRRIVRELLVMERVPEGSGKISKAPFLTPLLCELLSDELPLLPLAECLGRASRGFWGQGGAVFTTTSNKKFIALGPIWWRVTVAGVSDLGSVAITFCDQEISKFEFEIPWKETDRPWGSHFLPPACRIAPVDEREYSRNLDPPYNFARKVPDKDVAYITLGKEAWRRRLGTLSAELETLLDGNYCVSRSGQTFAPMFMRNHPSLDEEALEMLWPTIAKMLWKRQFEYVERFHQLPRNVMACGAVPKNTAPWRRLITDYRPSNVFVDPWPVRYISIRGLSLLLEINTLFWTRDLAGAYYNGVLGGCGGSPREVLIWILNKAKNGYVVKRSKRYGCGPGDCSNFCEKSLGGVCIGSHVMRLGACQFGAKTSNGPLSVFVDGFIEILRRCKDNIDAVSFVDDLLFYLKLLLWMERHTGCSGLAGGCLLCAEAARLGAAEEEFVDALLDELHIERSEKSSCIGQEAVFLGVIINTHEGRLRLTEEKYRKLVANLLEVTAWTSSTPRIASKVRGKLVNYSECVQSLRVFSVPFTVFIGAAKSNEDWDVESTAVSRMQSTAEFLLQHIDRMVKAGAPLWKLEPSTLYDKLVRGHEIGFDLRVATFDAAQAGVGVALRDGSNQVKWVRGRAYAGLSTVVTFPRRLGEMGELEHQAWREAWGAVLAVEIVLLDETVRNCVLLLVNDCVPVLAAIVKGSSRSPRLQAAAEAIHKACIPRGVVIMALHATGQQLIDEGVDDGSRKHAQALRGPACGELLRQTIREFADEIGCQITIDFFAAAENAMCQRFAAWTDEPDAEVVDAFTVRNWNVGLCVCGREHREWGFYFPPPGLEDGVVRRAKSDGVRGIFLVPRNRKAPYYQALRQNALRERDLGAHADLFVHARKQMSKHSLLAVDFGGGVDMFSPPCGQEGRRRPRGRAALPIEEEEARALVQHISSLGAEVRNQSGDEVVV